MTRKDFELIATAVRKQRDYYIAAFSADHQTVEAADDIAHSIAHELAETNPLFDAERFLTDCGIEA